jgi:type IV secretory pathway ATPase VirB11/archaellum biosynthesis ATPase
MTAPVARVLEVAGRSRLNVVISGGTGSGKTTLMNAMSRMIDVGERVVTIEDAAELQLQQPHVVRMETRPPSLEGKGEVTQRDLIRNALRMRPDRIIIGEVRGSEAFDMLQAMNTGHDGSMELSRGSAGDAEHNFAKLLMRTPNDRTAMNDLGVALDLQGRHAEAQDVYEKLLHIDPNNRPASVNLGLSLSLSGQADQSVAMLRGPATQPDATPRTRQDLAVALALSGDKDAAEKLLLTDLSPTDAAAALAGYEALNATAK